MNLLCFLPRPVPEETPREPTLQSLFERMRRRLGQLPWWQQSLNQSEGSTSLNFQDSTTFNSLVAGSLEFVSGDGTLRYTLRRKEEGLELEVITREVRWQRGLLGYAILTEFGDRLETGFVVLQPQPDGSFTAREMLSEVAVDRLRAEGCELRVAPVAATQLVEADRAALEVGVKRNANNLWVLAGQVLRWAAEAAVSSHIRTLLLPWFPHALETLLEAPEDSIRRTAASIIGQFDPNRAIYFPQEYSPALAYDGVDCYLKLAGQKLQAPGLSGLNGLLLWKPDPGNASLPTTPPRWWVTLCYRHRDGDDSECNRPEALQSFDHRSVLLIFTAGQQQWEVQTRLDLDANGNLLSEEELICCTDPRTITMAEIRVREGGVEASASNV